LTLNGVHLTAEGNRQLAGAIGSALFGKSVKAGPSLEKLRQAILDKNWCWHNRYRATDGNDVWGGRSKLSFVDGQSNAVVLQHELKMLDVMTANRDKRVWAVAKGGDLKVDDSNVPAPIPVKSNIGGKSKSSNASKEGTASYDKPEDSLKKLKPREGFTANLFADEKRFPEIVNPVQLGVGPKGRLWAAVWPTYPKWEPLKEMNDALVILPDENGDGVADKVIEFAKVHNPTGFTFWNGGVIVVSQPDILFLKDTDGDDKADVREIIMQGLDSADTHHAANNIVVGPDGGLYYQRGVFHVHSIEQPWRTTDINGGSAMYRFHPRNHKFRYHAPNSPNPHGISFDYWGYHYATDGTGGRGYQVVPKETGFAMRGFYKKKVRPVASSGIISSQHFPPEMEGDLLICNTIGFLGMKQYKPKFNIGTGEADGVEQPDLLKSEEKNFRPTDFEFGKDGALYVSDWSNVIIGHMQHNIRDPNRDHKHGRIYRITANGRPLQKDVPVAGQSIEKLLDNLKHPVNGIRERSRAELSAHPADKVIAATAKWVKQFDAKKKEDAHHLLEGLWIYQRLDVQNYPLLNALLASPEPHAVNAAKVVEHYWTGKADLPAPRGKKKPQKWSRPKGLDKSITDAEFKLGHEVYKREAHCATCHQENGRGLDKMYPPLKGPWVTGDQERLIKLALHGLMGEIEVEGKKYGKAGMPPMTPFKDLLSDKELAAVLTYVRNSFGNKAPKIEAATVAKVRASVKGRTMFWDPADLLKAHPIKK
jgi:mono/diheme cytochrome c family protein/glucose/arabinose dehydrogenase